MPRSNWEAIGSLRLYVDAVQKELLGRFGSNEVQFLNEEATPVDASIRRILLVDDEIDLWWDRDLAALAAAGYDVDTAEDGEAGWEALQTNKYDLLITDNKMPKLRGLELIKRLRDHGMILPIILASTLLPVIDPEQEFYFHDVHLLEKPVSALQLLASVEKSRAVQKNWSTKWSDRGGVQMTSLLAYNARSAQPYPHGGINE